MKTDLLVIADTGRTRRARVYWLDAGSDDLLDQLRVLNGFDIDLAATAGLTRSPTCPTPPPRSPEPQHSPPRFEGSNCRRFAYGVLSLFGLE